MPSPFPGMNPYLERQEEWDSFHTLFLGQCVKQLVANVGSQYHIRTGHRLYIHEPAAEKRRLFAHADVDIGHPQRTIDRGKATATAPKTAPMYRTIPQSVLTEKVNYIDIRSASGNAIITIFELLSRTNKLASWDRDLFLHKRAEILRSSSHYVELNLLRAGPPLPFQPSIVSPYYAAVSRANERDRVGTWEWGLHDPLPTIPIPLREPDRDVVSISNRFSIPCTTMAVSHE